jgi:hypothetical protein
VRALTLLAVISSAAIAQEPEAATSFPPSNEVSLHGAPTLGQWKRAMSVELGFPLITFKASVGLLDRLDFGLGFESYFGLTAEFLGFAKVNVFRGTQWSFSLAVEGEGSFFVSPAAVEVRGARWLTGHRNFGVSPRALLTYRATERSPRLFAQVDYLMTFDLESPTLLGHNVRAHLGAELPLSPTASFLFRFGVSVHGRPEDSRLMPYTSLGLVLGF